MTMTFIPQTDLFAPIVKAVLLQAIFQCAERSLEPWGEFPLGEEKIIREAMCEAMGVGAQMMGLILKPVIEDQARQLREFTDIP